MQYISKKNKAPQKSMAMKQRNVATQHFNMKFLKCYEAIATTEGYRKSEIRKQG